MNTGPQAYVEVLSGNRRICDFLASAGLGLIGAGTVDTWVISYKPGEVVDRERVERAMDLVIAESDREQTKIRILSYKVLSIV